MGMSFFLQFFPCFQTFANYALPKRDCCVILTEVARTSAAGDDDHHRAHLSLVVGGERRVDGQIFVAEE